MMHGIELRDVREDDLPIFYEHQQDPDACWMAAFASRNWEEFTAHWKKILADPTIIKQTIIFEDQVAGNIVSFEVSSEREVGYWIGKEFWGQGIATRALAAFLGLVKARPLFAHVAKHNIGSRRVLEKCGFAICGVDRWASVPGGDTVEEYIMKLSARKATEDHDGGNSSLV